MNSLSWFIYAVQLVDALTTVFAWAAVLTAATFFVRLILTTIRGESAYMNTTVVDGADDKARAAVWRQFNPQSFLYAGLFMLFVVIASVIPSRQTMLLIAGSEIGERFVTGDTVRGVVDPGVDLLKTWIKTETDRLTKAAAK